MKSLGRNQVEALVREVEDDAYGFARARVSHAPDGDAVLLDAFESEARSLATTTTTDLKERLRQRINLLTQPRRKRWTGLGGHHGARGVEVRAAHQPVAVPAALHARIVDRVEELQYVEPTGRRKAVLLSLLGACIVAALGAVGWVRYDALGAARPIVAAAFPQANAGDAPVQGEIRIIFRHSPSRAPHMTLQPTDGRVGSQTWDGTTLIVSYAGLRYGAHYHMTLDGEYLSRFKDRGHFQEQWSFTTEGYPRPVSVGPLNGATGVPRIGFLSVDFDHPAFVAPMVTLQPPDGTIASGNWVGQSWVVDYRDLKPSTTYQATVIVDYGVKNADINQSWTFQTEPGMPPAGVAVLWHSSNDPGNLANPPRMLALDWNGALVGTMYQPVTLQSPDGSIVGTADGTYLDRNGDRLSQLSGTKLYPMVADDDRSWCELSNTLNGHSLNQMWLLAGAISGPLRAVAPVGVFGAGGSGPGLIGCSTLYDRAVVSYSGSIGTSSVKVFSLSSGRVVFQQTYTLAVVNVISSRTGRYLAELMPTRGSQGNPTMTIIRRTSDGAIVARLDHQVVVRFSWDDERVVAGTPFQPGAPTVVTLLAWRTGRVLWTLPGPADEGGPVFAWAEPNGGKMAIASSSQAAWPLDRLWLVDADGQAKLVLSALFYPASVTGF